MFISSMQIEVSTFHWNYLKTEVQMLSNIICEASTDQLAVKFCTNQANMLQIPDHFLANNEKKSLSEVKKIKHDSQKL